MPVTLGQNVAEIVAGNFRAAEVFHRHRIDFCCGGSRTLEQACRERNLEPLELLWELNEACGRADASTEELLQRDAEGLIAYISGHHHAYVRRALPSLLAQAHKVAASHGRGHPELHEVVELVEALAEEMTSHMFKEEHILFPYIAAAAGAARRGEAPPPAPFGSVDNPIRMMEHEHDAAGAMVARIRELTSDYGVPDGACATYVTCLRELEEFERDLHMHVHLENNVLFPRARALEAEHS